MGLLPKKHTDELVSEGAAKQSCEQRPEARSGPISYGSDDHAERKQWNATAPYIGLLGSWRSCIGRVMGSRSWPGKLHTQREDRQTDRQTDSQSDSQPASQTVTREQHNTLLLARAGFSSFQKRCVTCLKSRARFCTWSGCCTSFPAGCKQAQETRKWKT